MPKIQLELSSKESQILKLYMLANGLESKRKAIKKIILEKRIETQGWLKKIGKNLK